MLLGSNLLDQKFSTWLTLRQKLELATDPYESASQFFLDKKKAKVYTDPWDQSTWPTPWELIDEDQYCAFNIVLGICYSLQLTERLKDHKVVINLALDTINKTVYYLLLIEDKVYGYADSDWISSKDLPKTLLVQKSYCMKPLH
jgi:hypothetical protein